MPVLQNKATLVKAIALLSRGRETNYFFFVLPFWLVFVELLFVFAETVSIFLTDFTPWTDLATFSASAFC